jgi:hypothetical protein
MRAMKHATKPITGDTEEAAAGGIAKKTVETPEELARRAVEIITSKPTVKQTEDAVDEMMAARERAPDEIVRILKLLRHIQDKQPRPLTLEARRKIGDDLAAIAGAAEKFLRAIEGGSAALDYLHGAATDLQIALPVIANTRAKIKAAMKPKGGIENYLLNFTIDELATIYENTANKIAAENCFVDNLEKKARGQFFDFVDMITGPTGASGRHALGTRIRRVLNKRAKRLKGYFKLNITHQP